MPTPRTWLVSRVSAAPVPPDRHEAEHSSIQNVGIVGVILLTANIQKLCSRTLFCDRVHKMECPRLHMFSGELRTLPVLCQIHLISLLGTVNFLAMIHVTIAGNTTCSRPMSPSHCQNIGSIKLYRARSCHTVREKGRCNGVLASPKEWEEEQL